MEIGFAAPFIIKHEKMLGGSESPGLQICRLVSSRKNEHFNLNKNERILTLTLSLLRNLPCGALERREFSESKVTLGNSFLLDERESQYDIGVGSTNETKHFFFFLIRNPW